MNIIYIHSHDTGRYVQPYGYGVPTPRIQQLAEQGVLFRQAFCVNPTCSPSRAALLTGTYPHECGMIGLAHRGARLNDARWHLASFLRSHGYETALAGFQHETRDGAETLGYDTLLSQTTAPSDATGPEADALRAARFIKTRDASRPFFLTVGFGLTHRTAWPQAPKGVQWHNGADSPIGDPRYVRPPGNLPDTPIVRQDFADFIEAAKRLDYHMGQVFDAVDDAGIGDETLIVCTTDHGIAFPNMKCSLTDHGIGVMLVLRGPGGFTGGKCIDELVSHLDIFPTLCELTGIDPPPRLRGRSLIGLVDGRREAPREDIFASMSYHAAYEPMRCVRTRRWKYIRRWNPRPHPVMPNCDDCPSKSELLAFDWCERPQPDEELYDLIFDPGESHNLADNPVHAADLADLRRRLEQWMRQTSDPLVAGSVPANGYRVNPADSLSPQAMPAPVSATEVDRHE